MLARPSSTHKRGKRSVSVGYPAPESTHWTSGEKAPEYDALGALAAAHFARGRAASACLCRATPENKPDRCPGNDGAREPGE